MAHGRGEAPRMETKRKFTEEPRNWDGGNAGVSEAPVIRSVQELIDCSLETFKRARNEAARKGDLFPIFTNGDDNLSWGNDQPANKTLPLHRGPEISSHHGGGSKPPREMDVPNLKASAGGAAAGGAAVGGAVDFGLELQFDESNSMSINLSKEFMREFLQDQNKAFGIKVKSTENERCVTFGSIEF